MNNDICKSKLLFLPTLLKASLHYAASVLVRSNLNAVVHAGIKYKLCKMLILLTTFAVRLFGVLGSLKYAQKGLNNMISVCAL
jgi:hypothetical protein